MSQKTFIIKLVALLVAGFSSVGLSIEAKANSIETGDGDEVIIVIQPREEQPGGGPRNPSEVPIEAYYDSGTASVCAYLSDAGQTVEVEFYNLTMNEYYSFEIPGNGFSVMPISGNSGYWTVSFTLLSGSIYDGQFLIQ